MRNLWRSKIVTTKLSQKCSPGILPDCRVDEGSEEECTDADLNYVAKFLYWCRLIASMWKIRGCGISLSYFYCYCLFFLLRTHVVIHLSVVIDALM